MEETLFFNLGNALASNFDTKELERTAQVEHLKRNKKGSLVIVKDPNDQKKEQILFDLSDQEKPSSSNYGFTVTKIIK